MVRFVSFALAAQLLVGAGHAACPPAGHTPSTLQTLKRAQWQVSGEDAARTRQALAVALIDCLADPDPRLRDELAYEALANWMRGGHLEVRTLQTIRAHLLTVMSGPPDAPGFAQPFAALTLAEVARVDRLQPFLSDEERDSLVVLGARYLSAVRDYRGFEPQAGWRHGVAHGADLMLQLSLNPRLLPAQADTILAAIAAQVLPVGEHAYRYGEPERLMAPAFYLARRGWWQAADWERWFAALETRRAKGQPPSVVSLAQRHNLVAFLSAFYVAVQEQGDAAMTARVLPALRQALKAVD